MPIPVFALMLGVFCVGTAEVAISGLLPNVAADLVVTVPSAGLLVTGYALGVTVIGPAVTLLTSRVRRKPLVLGLMAVFVAGNLVAVVAPNYGLLMAARVFTATSHGTFVALAFYLAVLIAPPGRKGSAMAKISLGFNLANALGSPLGTFVGQRFGWRSTFAVIAVVAIVTVVLIAVFLHPPADRAQPAGRSNLRAEVRELGSPALGMAVVITVLAQGAVFTTSTYLVPILQDVSGFAPGLMSALLVVFGVGSVCGNFAGGRIADGHVLRGVLLLLSTLTAVCALFWVVAPVPALAVGAVLLFGAAGFSIIPSLQTHIETIAAAAPTLALSVNVSAFNLGNGLGAWLGGQVIDLGMGTRSVLLTSAVVCGASLALTAGSYLLGHGAQKRTAVPATAG
ncbi:MFS transporter [Saccharopolyspora sp. HNM0986]|uniref:MFS transporter n=1 Tax=Saccharopolyspora galaxeae TaxID=2781241 RepID=UPI00190AF6EA|nr:MFS transporter [Saccharopolyspora sp. HNM0986]MBK0869287.1 MFS transporter [Saccharopolyspora sp. HNM0986]